MLDINVNLREVDTSMPVLEKGKYGAVIKDCEVLENKEKTGHNLKVSFATIEPGTSTKGEPVNPGFPLSRFFPLQQSSNPKAPPFLRDICKLIDAALGTDDTTRPENLNSALEDIKGRELTLVLTVREATDEYDATNDVRGFEFRA